MRHAPQCPRLHLSRNSGRHRLMPDRIDRRGCRPFGAYHRCTMTSSVVEHRLQASDNDRFKSFASTANRGASNIFRTARVISRGIELAVVSVPLRPRRMINPRQYAVGIDESAISHFLKCQRWHRSKGHKPGILEDCDLRLEILGDRAKQHIRREGAVATAVVEPPGRLGLVLP